MTAGANELSRSQQYRMNRSFNPNPLRSPKNLIWNRKPTIISSFYETVVTTVGFFVDRKRFPWWILQLVECSLDSISLGCEPSCKTVCFVESFWSIESNDCIGFIPLTLVSTNQQKTRLKCHFAMLGAK